MLAIVRSVFIEGLVLAAAACLACAGCNGKTAEPTPAPVVEMECTLHVITDLVVDPAHPGFDETAGLAEGLAGYRVAFKRRTDRSDTERRTDPGASLTIGAHTIHAQEELERIVRLEWRHAGKVVASASAQAVGRRPGREPPSELELEVRPILDEAVSHDNRAWIACSNRELPAQ